MDFAKVIEGRKSVRSYADKPVSRDDILACVEAARLAPSACNVQPWKFLVVDDLVLKEQVAEAAFSKVTKFNGFVKSAPVIIVVMANPDLVTNTVFAGIQRLPYYLLDIGAACEQLLLQAHALGLGTCWIGWFKEKAIKKVLAVPRRFKIVSLISMGYPNEEAKVQQKKRKPLDEIIAFNQL